MPIYEFECRLCKKKFDALIGQGRKVSDIKCPKCGSGKLDKLFSAFGFKGSPEGKTVTSAAPSGCSSCQASSCDGCKG